MAVWQVFDFSHDSCCLFINGTKMLSLLRDLKDKIFTNLFHAIVTSVYIVLIFYTIKCQNHGCSIPAGDMFTYFCSFTSRVMFENNFCIHELFQLKIVLKKRKTKSDNMVVNDIKILLKMKNKG